MAATKKKTAPVEQEEDIVEEKSAPMKAKDIDLTQYIEVINGFQGTLTYISKRTGETFHWNEFGDTQEIELRELRNAKSSDKAFFEKNWFMFSDEFAWVIDYLGVSQFYKNALPVDGFDDIFSKSPKEIETIVPKLSEGQKNALAYRAKQLIEANEMDSIRVVNTLEKCLGIDLIDRD